jgi:succinylglutamate desuccinylase
MLAKLQAEINTFKRLAQSGTELCSDGFVLQGERTNRLVGGRKIDVSFLALTHGNEVGGIAVINDIASQIIQGQIKTDLNVAFLLGNVEAALANKRFLSSDLNRSFGTVQTDDSETRRAKELAKIFLDSGFVVDFHQTQSPADSAFLISRFDATSFTIFRETSDLPAIVYEGTFSENSMTTLNYHLANGGFGYGIELGEKGFDPKQIALGIALAEKTISNLSERKTLERTDHRSVKADPMTFTFAETIKSHIGSYELSSDLRSMSIVSAGKPLARLDGMDIVVDRDTRILFPRYPTESELLSKQGMPVEIVRTLRPFFT